MKDMTFKILYEALGDKVISSENTSFCKINDNIVFLFKPIGEQIFSSRKGNNIDLRLNKYSLVVLENNSIKFDCSFFAQYDTTIDSYELILQCIEDIDKTLKEDTNKKTQNNNKENNNEKNNDDIFESDITIEEEIKDEDKEKVKNILVKIGNNSLLNEYKNALKNLTEKDVCYGKIIYSDKSIIFNYNPENVINIKEKETNDEIDFEEEKDNKDINYNIVDKVIDAHNNVCYRYGKQTINKNDWDIIPSQD